MPPGKGVEPVRRANRTIHAAAILLGVVAAAAWVAAPPQRLTGDVEEWLRLLREHEPGVLDGAARQISGWEWSRLQPVLQELHRRAHPTVVLRSAALLSDIAFDIPSNQRHLANLAGGTVVADDGRVQGAGSLDGHRYLRASGRDDETARRAFVNRARALPLPSPDAWRVR
jgi:hypothetical protein